MTAAVRGGDKDKGVIMQITTTGKLVAANMSREHERCSRGYNHTANDSASCLCMGAHMSSTGALKDPKVSDQHCSAHLPRE